LIYSVKKTREGRRLLTDRTSALQCTERVDYSRTERVCYKTQGAYITDGQNECVTKHRARTLQTNRTSALQYTERV